MSIRRRSSTIPLRLRIREFFAAKKEWERARRARAEAWIIFEAAEKLKKLEEEGPDSIVLPKRAYVD